MHGYQPKTRDAARRARLSVAQDEAWLATRAGRINDQDIMLTERNDRLP